MDADIRRVVHASGYEEPGFADRYDSVRPRPPAALRTLVAPLVSAPLRRVVDLGSGTGLSTRLWADVADEVIGVEPSAVMRERAVRSTTATNVRYVDGTGIQTGCANGSVDLVTAAQSLHWMDPDPTFREITRILRPGAVLCIYEYFAIVTPVWELVAAYDRVRAAVRRVRSDRRIEHGVPQWPVSVDRIRASGSFDYIRETALHSVEQGTGERLLEIALSEGSLTTLLAAGVAEKDVDLPELRRIAATIRKPVDWWIGYHVWLARRTAPGLRRRNSRSRGSGP